MSPSAQRAEVGDRALADGDAFGWNPFGRAISSGYEELFCLGRSNERQAQRHWSRRRRAGGGGIGSSSSNFLYPVEAGMGAWIDGADLTDCRRDGYRWVSAVPAYPSDDQPGDQPASTAYTA